MMKTSKYNICKKIQNRYFVYNTLHNSTIEITKNVYKLLKSKDITDIDSFSNQQLYNNLKKGNYLIENDLDELQKLLKSYKKAQKSLSTLIITIAPSLNCNFACKYCYENKKRKKMSEKEQLLLLEFIENQIKLGYRSISVVWFGGEPTLTFDIITKLSEKILKLVKKYKIKYSATITTNGYLLTKDIVKKFNKLQINQAFITLDGTAEIHNKRRHLISGKDTFYKIIENIKLLKENDVNVLIRMNVDKDNISNIKELANFVENDLQLPFYLGHTRQYTGACDPDNEKYLSKAEYAKTVYELNRYQQKKAITVNPFRSLKTYCRACNIGTYVIDPDLNLFKCENDIGVVEKSIGNIKNITTNNLLSHLNISPYLRWNPFDFEKCRNCSLLPLCMGGCPFVGIKNGESECDAIKFSIRDYLKDYLIRKYIDN